MHHFSYLILLFIFSLSLHYANHASLQNSHDSAASNTRRYPLKIRLHCHDNLSFIVTNSINYPHGACSQGLWPCHIFHELNGSLKLCRKKKSFDPFNTAYFMPPKSGPCRLHDWVLLAAQGGAWSLWTTNEAFLQAEAGWNSSFQE